jgi:hypothetical protein
MDSIATTDELVCHTCGDACFVDSNEISFHASEKTPDGIDHDKDSDHVAVPVHQGR